MAITELTIGINKNYGLSDSRSFFFNRFDEDSGNRRAPSTLSGQWEKEGGSVGVARRPRRRSGGAARKERPRIRRATRNVHRAIVRNASVSLSRAMG